MLYRQKKDTYIRNYDGVGYITSTGIFNDRIKNMPLNKSYKNIQSKINCFQTRNKSSQIRLDLVKNPNLEKQYLNISSKNILLPRITKSSVNTNKWKNAVVAFSNIIKI